MPFTLVADDYKGRKLRSGGPAKRDAVRHKLCDVAPTILDLLAIPKPEEMDGRSLIVKE